MLQIKDTLISTDILDNYFCCDLSKCKGICCVKGDAGAPLTKEEVELLPKIIPQVRPFMRKEGMRAIDEQGTHVIDDEKETVTPLIDGKECAYVVFEEGIAACAIEKAFEAGKVRFRKPVSCHLYPVRIRKYEKFTAVNYDRWDICQPARDLGKSMKIPVYQFVKDALVRRFGEDWFRHLSIASEELQKNKP